MPFPEIANDFKLAVEALTAKNRKNTLDDYNHELSDVDVGRQARFFNKENSVTQQAKRRKASERLRQLTALQALLNSDPEYAKLYNDVTKLLSEAEIRADNVLEICREKLEHAERMHQENLDNATRLSDGKRVFQGKDGAAYDENDQLIDPDIAEGIIWHKSSPSRDKFKADKEFLNESQSAYDKAYHERYSVLGEIREKVENENEPMKFEELDSAQKLLTEYNNASTEKEINFDQSNQPTQDNISHELQIPEIK